MPDKVLISARAVSTLYTKLSKHGVRHVVIDVDRCLDAMIHCNITRAPLKMGSRTRVRVVNQVNALNRIVTHVVPKTNFKAHKRAQAPHGEAYIAIICVSWITFIISRHIVPKVAPAMKVFRRAAASSIELALPIDALENIVLLAACVFFIIVEIEFSDLSDLVGHVRERKAVFPACVASHRDHFGLGF